MPGTESPPLQIILHEINQRGRKNQMDIKVKIYAPELAAAIQSLADALRCAVNQEEPKEEETPTSENLPQYTLEQVRAKLASLAQSGKQKEVKELIASFGVKKLTDIPEDKYPEVMEKAEEIA
jgi:hypothetical protein